MKLRLDRELLRRGLVSTRSQAESYIKLGYVTVNGLVDKKAGSLTSEKDNIEITINQQYVSRAALKLASVAELFKLQFKDLVVLDVGSSTGGFTDFALRSGARKVIDVEVGSHQLHESLRSNPKIELHEQTDIRDINQLSERVDIILIDVSFISLRDILPFITSLCDKNTKIVAMVKPQFEAIQDNLKHKGVIKNNKIRRDILKNFELWAQNLFIIINKADSNVTGAKGNHERFYLLKKSA